MSNASYVRVPCIHRRHSLETNLRSQHLEADLFLVSPSFLGRSCLACTPRRGEALCCLRSLIVKD